MPAFRPCIGTRAQVDATPVRDGQMLVAADTGEAFVDFGGVRVRLSGPSGDGGAAQPDDDGDGLLTGWAVASAALLMSASVPGGGPGDGVLNAPAVLLPDFDNELLTAYSITEGR